MQLPSILHKGKLIKRYKRFLADIELEDGQTITAHCPNSGSMKGLKEPGMEVYVSPANDPKRKLTYTWELVRLPSSLVGINTNVPNKLVQEALQNRSLQTFEGYRSVKPEKVCAPGTRLDFYVSDHEEGRKDAYIEVKNVTLREGNKALFPDAVTERGTKHLRVLMDMMDQGYRAALIFVVQRQDVQEFRPAKDIDPVYAKTLQQAIKRGVEIFCYTCYMSCEQIILDAELPVAF